MDSRTQAKVFEQPFDRTVTRAVSTNDDHRSVGLIDENGRIGKNAKRRRIDDNVIEHLTRLAQNLFEFRAGDQLCHVVTLVAAGKNVTIPEGALVIDAAGKQITPGIIDCHSHMATDGGVNESSQAITAEVRVGDFIDNDDITIYRQLAGGLTSSNILHGSANSIGGQTQLIKLRWGVCDTALKFKGADGFIKFALGENVKRTTSQNNNRFPDTRMGVDQVFVDAFTRATDYEKALKGPDAKNVRRDLELDALVEIMKAPATEYSTTPFNTMKFADHMSKVGTLKTKPKAWTDYYLPLAHDLKGS